jgi:hypothetical protein
MTTHGNRSPGRWRKSSYSGNNGNCVEIGVIDLSPAGGGWRKSSYSDGNGGNCVEIGVIDLSPATGEWQKSSYSGSNGECVEISVIDGGQMPGDHAASVVRLLAVRDSKDPAGPRLHFTPGAWNTFARDIKDGAFDNPT